MINTLSGTSASPSSSVGVAQDVYLLKLNRFILLDKVELADAGSFRDNGMPDCDGRESPNIFVAIVVVLYDADAVGHQNTERLAGRGPGNHLSIIAFRQFHGYAEGYDAEFKRLQLYVLCCTEVNPFTVTDRQLVAVRVDSDLVHYECPFLLERHIFVVRDFLEVVSADIIVRL